jgi:hypothetical protein
MMEIPKLKIGNKEYNLMGQREIKGIKFIVLNSSWFSRDDEDQGKLYIGLPQLKVMESADQLIDPEKRDTEQITVSVLHHPPGDLNRCENGVYSNRKATFPYLCKHSHMVLSGHLHYESISKPTRYDYDGTLLFIGGTAYSGDDYGNNFSILKINKINRTVDKCNFKYNPAESEWTKIPGGPYKLTSTNH